VTSSKKRRTEKPETVRPTAFYDTIEKERQVRGWRVRQFGDWLGLGDRIYKWRTLKPSNLPEAETLIRVAVRLEWTLDRLLRGVSAAYDAQADKRRNSGQPETARALNTGMEQQRTTGDGDNGEWAKLHGTVAKPDPPSADTRDQRAALLDLLTPEQWALVRTIIGLGVEEAAEAQSLLRRWLGQREPTDATTATHRNQGGSAPPNRSGNDR
jgi:hypothetical protein